MAREDSSDLASLQAPAETTHAVAKSRQGRGIRPAASAVVVGYPLRGLLASEANVSTGAVSALAGPGDDRRLIQITAPVQPGNSGGPVLDAAGNVVGVVVAKLDAIKIARSTGDIPQNVNFAVSAGTARAFLDAEGVPTRRRPPIRRWHQRRSPPRPGSSLCPWSAGSSGRQRRGNGQPCRIREG